MSETFDISNYEFCEIKNSTTSGCQKIGIRKFEFLIFLSENQPVEWKLLKGNMAEVYNCIHPNNLVERF